MRCFWLVDLMEKLFEITVNNRKKKEKIKNIYNNPAYLHFLFHLFLKRPLNHPFVLKKKLPYLKKKKKKPEKI